MTFRLFRRVPLLEFLHSRTEALSALALAMAAEADRADRIIVGLGTGSAEQRVARLIWNLTGRVRTRQLHNDPDAHIPFPLRQHHVADAAGLTPVHVSKVLTEFGTAG